MKIPQVLEGCRVTAIAPYCFSSAEHIPKGNHFLTAVGGEQEKHPAAGGTQGEEHPAAGGTQGEEHPAAGGTQGEERPAAGGRQGEEHSAAAGEQAKERPAAAGMHRELREFAGNLVEEVVLPDSVAELGKSAFYNCKKLRRLSIGSSLAHVGSDAFMNTINFHELVLRCPAGRKTGLKQILAQISSDMEVKFQIEGGQNEVKEDKEDKTEAALFYPEYYESYDEIAPAHLFGRSITGEGFRARQAFKEGVLDFAGYDGVFPKACAEETEKTLSKMAFNRLYYPFMLTEKHSLMYREYLLNHVENLAKDAVAERKLDVLRFLCQTGLLSGGDLKYMIQYAGESEWAKGAAELLRIHASQQEKEKRDGYAFEEF